jgi:esterase/lipase superfamily enzyme
MQRRYETFYSSALEQEIELLVFGHYGPPMLVFPTQGGRFYDFENYGMIEAVAPLLDAGKLKLYCTDSLAEPWLQTDIDLEWRGKKHHAFQEYIVKDLVPVIHMDCKNTLAIGLIGCDFGAYHAANFALQFPHLFHYALCLSGRYDLEAVSGIKNTKEIYLNNPMAYVPNLHGEALEQILHHTHLVLVCGQGAHEEPCFAETQQLASLLNEKHISHEKDIWGFDVDHHWYWWRKQLVQHLGKALG